MDSNENNSSHAVHPSPPLPGGQTRLLDPNSRRPHEEMIRRIVREEIHVGEERCKMFHNLPPPWPLSDPKIPAQYKLQFMNKVKNTFYTTDLVKDVNGHPIQVGILEMRTKSITSPDNVLSSAKVELIVLDAGFCTNRVNWSPSEFHQKVLTGRERKGLILTGCSLIIPLENGVGTFENIVVNDNSSWTKSGFRLGVMVKGEGEEGYLNGERVQEAVSECFRVLDRRGKVYQKPDRLKMEHSVRCIKKIGKDRASLLQKDKIEIVGDFYKSLKNDGAALRKILGIKSEYSKVWESIVEDVMHCDDEYHVKCIASNNSSQPQQALDNPVERNIPLGTNVGHPVVGSGSSEPNPSENDIIEGDVPATNKNPVVGLGSLEPNPSKNDINEGDVPATNKPLVPCLFKSQMIFGVEWEKQKKERLDNEFGSMPRTNGAGIFPQSELPLAVDRFLDDCTYFGQLMDDSTPNYGGSDGFPQPEVSFDPFLSDHSFWGAHVASAPNYNQSFLGAGGNNGSSAGGSGGGGGGGGAGAGAGASASAGAGGNNGSSGGGNGGGGMEGISLESQTAG